MRRKTCNQRHATATCYRGRAREKKLPGTYLEKYITKDKPRKKNNEGTDLLRVTHLPGIDWSEQHEMDPALYTETKQKNTHISIESLQRPTVLK